MVQFYNYKLHHFSYEESIKYFVSKNFIKNL